MELIVGVGAAASLGAIWRGAGRSARIWVPMTAVTLLALGAGRSVSFAAWFITATLLAFGGLIGKRTHPFHALMFAVSDVLLVCAVQAANEQTTLWTMPPPGGWGDASILLALSAVARLAAPLVLAPRATNGVLFVGWAQGAVLAALAGPGAAQISVPAAILVLCLCLKPGSRSSGLAYAGAAIIIAAALGADPPQVSLVAASGLAMALGERWFGLWGWAAAPFSILATTPVSASMAAVLALAVGLPALALAVEETCAHPRTTGGRGIAIVGVIIAAVASGAPWWLLVTAASAAALTWWLRAERAPIEARPREPEPAVPYALTTAVLAGLAWLGAASILGWLAIRGLSTGFL